MSPRLVHRLMPVLLLSLGLPAHATEDALREGNRIFRRGDLEAAFEIYEAGYAGNDPVLAYNLGTTAHHLGRLPEAVLWYRRAEADAGGDVDRWLTRNLESARRALDAPRLSPPAPWSVLESHRYRLTWIAVALAWLSLGLLLVSRRRTSRGWLHLADGAGLLGSILFVIAILSSAFAPIPAVLLEPCGSTGNRLAAGSEVWGRFDPDRGFQIRQPDGRDLTCPEESVGRIRPATTVFLLR